MLEQLKKDYPTMSEEVLKVVADEEGIDTSPATTEQEEVEATTEPAEQEETDEEENFEETEDETESPDEETKDAEPAEQEKKVSLKALHEERNKRKALSAQLEAMKSEIEAIKNRPQQPVQQQTQQPDISEWVEQQAEKDVRDRLKVTEPLDELQWSDPAKYRKVTKEIAKTELRLENEINNRNQLQSEVNQNLAHFNSQPDFKEVDIYAEQTLNELPLKDARPIQQAVDSLNRGTITKEQISTLKGFYEKCQTEYRDTIKSPKVAKPADKIAEMAKHPRASQLSGSNGSRSLSTAEIETMLDQGRFEDVPPEVIKKYMR